jgi:hypothetical protein
MNTLSNYFKSLAHKGIQFILVEYISKNNSWKYKLYCEHPINSVQNIDTLLKEIYCLVEDLILDGYEVEIVDDFNLLIKRL